MKHSLKEETFKFVHQGTPFWGALILLVLMTYGALTSHTNSTQIIFEFGATEWIPIITIAVSSAFFSMEYQYRTILMILYRKSNKWEIYIAKLVVLWLYSVLLVMVAAIYTICLKSMTAGSHYYWLMPIAGGNTLLHLMVNNMLGTLIYALFIITLAFMLIMLVKINAIVISIGLALGFLGAGISTALMETFPALTGVIRWNPLSMIFFTSQLANPSSAGASHLSNGELTLGTLGYATLFALGGLALFNKRRS